MLSVLIPAYNAESFVKAAIVSVIKQELDCPVEILVCDDASTDNTAKIITEIAAQDARIKLITHEKNRGIAGARNTLLDNIDPQSEFIVFFDADDVFAPGGLANGLARLKASSDHMFVSGCCQTVPTEHLGMGETIAHHWPKIAGVFLGSKVFRRVLVDRIGGFDETFALGEDTDFLMRAGELTKAILFHDDVVYYYRRHPHNITNDQAGMKSGFMRAALLHARRRKADLNLYDARDIFQASDPAEMKRSMDLHG